jgi:hypothetical protein
VVQGMQLKEVGRDERVREKDGEGERERERGGERDMREREKERERERERERESSSAVQWRMDAEVRKRLVCGFSGSGFESQSGHAYYIDTIVRGRGGGQGG